MIGTSVTQREHWPDQILYNDGSRRN